MAIAGTEAMMATKPVPLGPIGRHAAAAIARIRAERGWDQKALAGRLETTGRGLSASVISKIESGARRVDVDDLVAIATALEVGPALLILAAPTPPSPLRDDNGEPTGRARPVETAVREDIDALGDLVEAQPSLAQMALKLARQVDDITVRACVCGEEIPGRGDAVTQLPSLTKELRATLAQLLEARAPEEDDDDLGDLGEPG